MLTIKELRASGFRGLRSGPTLKFGHGGLLLQGCNGVGKTSWVDAIEKTLTGRCSSIETGDQAVSWARHGTHIREKHCSVLLVLTDGFKNYPVSLSTEDSKLPFEVKSLRSAARQYSFILRRRTLLEFILAKPQDRYKAIQGFLNVDEYAGFERKVKDLLQGSNSRTSNLEVAIQSDEAALRAKVLIPVSQPITDESIVRSICDLLEAAGLDSVKSLDEFPSRAATAKELMEAFGDVESLGNLNSLHQSCTTLPSDEELNAALDAWTKASAALSEAEAGLKRSFYTEVLTQGLQWIKAEGLATCPLCDSPISATVVEAAVNDKLAKHKHLTRLRTSCADAKRSLESALQVRLNGLRSIQSAWPAVMPVSQPELLLQRVLQLEEGLRTIRESETTNTIVRVREAARSLDLLRQELIQRVEAEKKLVPDQKRYGALFAAHAAISAVISLSPDIAKNRQRLASLQWKASQLRRIAELIEHARKAAVQQLVESVADTADKYFQMIHPGESIGKPMLEVPERGSGSLTLSGEFYGHRSDPRGHYSEGHLDSLGLCIFLAIRRLHHEQQPELALLILDDVLHSVDADHRRKTAKMIVNEFSDHQILITTHDPLWLEHLKVVTRTSGFLLQRINSWTIEDGPTLTDYLADYEWLVSAEAKNAKPADKVITAGRLLEETLQNLCHNLSVSIPYRRGGDYTIDPLWTNFMKSAKSNAEFWSAAQKAICDIDELRMLRNLVGAHWNEWAQQLTPSEADDFCAAVVALRNASYCHKCGDFLERIAQLDGVWSCKKEHIRYNKKHKIGASQEASVIATIAASDQQQDPN